MSGSRSHSRSVLALMILAVAASPGGTLAQTAGGGEGTLYGPPRHVRVNGIDAVMSGDAASHSVGLSEASTPGYWTPEKMAAAKPMLPPAASLERAEVGVAPADLADPPGPPGWVDGQPPLAARQSSADSGAEAGAELDESALLEMTQPGNHDSPSSSSYPFVGFRWFYPQNKFPVSAIGKLFFTMNGSNFVCSAATIGPNHVATAGHCLHAGNNSSAGWATNVLFCPQYNNGASPKVGCWYASSIWVGSIWYASGNADRDWGGARMNSTGTVKAKPIGDVTGWLGYAWNFGNPVVMQFGYSSASPFNGMKLILCNTVVNGYVNFGTGAVSQHVGCHQRPGSSGGPWIIGFGPTGSNPNAVTHNWLAGVNSQIFCSGGCTGSNYVNRWTSPGFTSESGGSKEFLDFLLTR